MTPLLTHSSFPRPPTDELNDSDIWEMTIRGKVKHSGKSKIIAHDRILESDWSVGQSFGLLESGRAVGLPPVMEICNVMDPWILIEEKEEG